MVGWLRRLCGGWVRNAGNKAQLRPAGAGALPELGNIKEENQNLSNILDPCNQSYFSVSAVYAGTMYKLNWNKLID